MLQGRLTPPLFYIYYMRAAVINLQERHDRLRDVTQQLTQFGIVRFDIFKAHSKPDALRGNAQSHYDLLSGGYDLIFEDDVYFECPVMDILPAIAELPNDWDILYLGGNVVEKIEQYSAHLHRCTAAWGSFAIMYSEKGRRYVLNAYNPKADNFTIYDEWLRLQSKRLMKSYILSSPAAWTKGGFSDVNNRIENYEPQMRKNAIANIL